MNVRKVTQFRKNGVEELEMAIKNVALDGEGKEEDGGGSSAKGKERERAGRDRRRT